MFTFWLEAYVSCAQAWLELANVAAHPYEANHVGAPYDRASEVAQGVIEFKRPSTTKRKK